MAVTCHHRLAAFWLLLAIVPTALAGERLAVEIPIESVRFWVLMAIVQVLTTLGWAASSIDKLAGWLDATSPTWADRLAVVKTGVCSSLAGNGAFLAALYWQQTPEVVALLSAGAGGYLGDQLLQLYANRFKPRQ